MTGIKLKEQYISYLPLIQTLNNISVIMLLRTFNIISLILALRKGDYVIADRVANSVDTDCPDQSIPLLRTVIIEWLQGSSIFLYIWGIAHTL